MTLSSWNTATVASAGGGETVMWVDASSFDLSDSDVIITDNSAHPVASFADGATGEINASVIVPSGGSTISSIQVIYFNTEEGTNLYLTWYVALIDVSGMPVATDIDSGDTASTYATGATDNRYESESAPAGSFDGISTPDNGDILAVRLFRTAGNASDTYNAAWLVAGLLFTFS